MQKTQKKYTYNLEDYNSNDGMLTTVWGPGMWHYLHTMSFNYPVSPCEDDKQHYMSFIKSLIYVLPCGKCRKNLRKNFKRLPLTIKHMESRDKFSRYIYKLHEVVNKMLGKTSGLTFEEVRERYEHFRSRCTKSYKNIKKCSNKSKKNNTKKMKKIESGCTEPLYGEKSKCVLQIVPQTEKCQTLQIDNKCIKKNMATIIKEQEENQ
uniref:thiol oxidase n=1 Tax=viral metagenome TaxID=1070528 RepID=A0A6C0HZ93_9ZZZZ